MNITRFTPRKFLPEKIDLTDITQLETIFDRLTASLAEVKSIADLKKWLEKMGEAQAAMDECSALIYIAMTCQTDDPAREKAHLHMVEVVQPWTKPRVFALMKDMVAMPAFKELAKDEYYHVFCRSVKVQVGIYREKNVAQETELAKLSQTYQKICGAMTVTFEGKEQTLTRMGRIQEDVDRESRKNGWEAVVNRRLQDAEALEALFDQMLRLRIEIAREAGFLNYRDYMFAVLERFDYTAADCLNFHRSIEHHIVPLSRQLDRERQAKLGLEELRPWDLAVDPNNRPPLRPFQTGAELMEKSAAIFDKMDPRLGHYFQVLKTNELVDLENRKGKAPGGYQSTLNEARSPFIFMNAVGQHGDLETLFHEAGHAFHALARRDLPLYEYRACTPTEFAEVASMSMELMVKPYLSEFYKEDEAKQARIQHLHKIVKLFPWIAMIDAFQHWIYTHPEHTHAERRSQWVELSQRFGGLANWIGYEEALAYSWHRVLHIFELPFYIIEYAIAQLGALQMWRLARKDLPGSIELYLNGLKLGGSQPLPQLFSATGLKLDFGGEIIARLMDDVKKALAADEAAL